MLVFAYYLLKIIICSTVLFGYYWFLLRNKIYHAYNRYYLLAIVCISLTFPLLNIQIFNETAAKTTVVKMLQVVNAGDEYIDGLVINSPAKFNIEVDEVVLLIYTTISLLFFIFLVQMLISIFKLIQKNEKIKIENINFINTDAAKGTPFSFFQFIFWNRQIDLKSAAGNRIFKHELAHIQERHSWDKMFINLVLIVFWINPIFWLVRKELSMIHEFIADKKAVEDGDTAAFAAMILEATYPQRTLFLTNNFFYSPIKRRLMMLTKIKNTRTSYISRLLVLPLLVFVFAAFTLKIVKKVSKENFTEKSGNKIVVVLDAGHGGSDNGAINKDGITEKDISLQLVKKIKALNTDENIEIILTRENDVFADPKQKAAFAKDHHADIFISVHLDNSPKNEWNLHSGMNVYIAKDGIANVDKSKVLAASTLNSFKSNYELKVPINITQKQKGVWILQANTFPSILIEAGYLTNDKDLAYLLSEKGQTTFARNILDAISYYAVYNVKSDKFVYNQFLNDTLYYFNGKQIKKGELALKMQNYNKIEVKLYKPKEAESKFKTTKNESVFEVIGRTEGFNDVLNNTIINKANESNPNAGLSEEPAASISVKRNKNLKILDERSLTENPLYIINRKISDKKIVELLSPNDIESVNVLKGSSATALYGEKGKNGVIEITTKTTKTIQDSNRIIFTKAEIEAQFPGGKEAWQKYLQKNLNGSIAVDEGWKPGTYVFITKFIVEKDGTLSDFIAEKYPNSQTAKHCIAILKNGPKWLPAMQNGNIVASIKKQLITFVIAEETDNDKKKISQVDPSIFKRNKKGMQALER